MVNMKTYEVVITDAKKTITVNGSGLSMPKHQEDFDNERKEFSLVEQPVGVRELAFGLLIDSGVKLEDARLLHEDLSKYVARRFDSNHGKITSGEILEFRTFEAAGFLASQNVDLNAPDRWPRAGGLPSLIASANSSPEVSS